MKRMAIRRTILLLFLIVPALTLQYSCSTTPDTPENAVIEFFVARQMGHYDRAEQKLCSSLIENPGSEATYVFQRFVAEAGTIYGEGTLNETDDEATVRLAIGHAPSRPISTHSIDDLMSGRAGMEVRKHRDPWIAHMVKEDGKWKLCGLEPIDPVAGNHAN